MVSLMQEANVVPLASRGGDAGALLVVRRNPDPEAKPVMLADMKGKRLAYADASAFGPKSWLDVRVMQLGEDPETFWGQTERRARVLPDVLTPLSTGRIDAALLPGCLWERLHVDGLIDPDRFTPVTALRPEPEEASKEAAAASGEASRTDTNTENTTGEESEPTPGNAPGRCLSTTVRYPDWMLGYAPSAPNDTLRQLAAAVFETEGEENLCLTVRSES